MNKEDVKDVLLAMLHNYYGRLQHYESQRAVVTNLVIIVAAAILAFVTFDQKLRIADAPLILLSLLLGIFGAAFCAKYYERSVRI